MVSIFDITDPVHPHQMSIFVDTVSYASGSATGAAMYMVVTGNYLYLSATRTAPTGNSFGFKIIDVSNPSSPVKVGTFNVTNGVSQGIAVNSNYAYVCFGSLGLIVVDVSNPALPVQVGSLILTGGFPAVDIFISGNYAYIIDNASKLHIINITNPISPAEVGNFQLSAIGNDVYAEGNYAYVSVGTVGFQIIDVSVPSSPVLAGSYPSVSVQSAIYNHGNYVYLDDFYNGMQVVNVSTPASPVQAGYYYDNVFVSRNVYADSLHSYLAADEGLYIFNGSGVISTDIHSSVDNQFSVYPNPFESSVTFSSQKQSLKTISYSIKNIQGQILCTQQVAGLYHSYSKTIDLSFLAKGIYFLDATIDGDRSVKKIVKE
jgi:hypothetical protein